MRPSHVCLVLALFLLAPVIGCGGSSEPQAVDASELQSYVDSNAEEMARQAELEAQRDSEPEEE